MYIVFVGLNSSEFVTPSYATSFPSNYSFVRIMDYRQQSYVDSEYNLLDFEFPWTDAPDESKYHEEVACFCKNVLGKEIVDKWVWNKARLDPVSTKRNIELAEHQTGLGAESNVVPMGRCGVHACCSKDTCLRMSIIVAENLDALTSGSAEQKRSVLLKLRENLT